MPDQQSRFPHQTGCCCWCWSWLMPGDFQVITVIQFPRSLQIKTKGKVRTLHPLVLQCVGWGWLTGLQISTFRMTHTGTFHRIKAARRCRLPWVTKVFFRCNGDQHTVLDPSGHPRAPTCHENVKARNSAKE